MTSVDPPASYCERAGAAQWEWAITTDPANSVLERLLEYWLQRCGGRRFPSRADIDPLDFKFALGRVSLVDCRAEAPQFRYRLVSTELTETLGYEMTGRYAEHIPEPEVRAYVLDLYRRAVLAAVPLRDGGERVLDGRRWFYRSLVLPFSDDGESVTMLLVYREAAAKRPPASV